MVETTLSAMDAVGVTRALLHPLDDETADLAIAELPDRIGVVRTLDPTAADMAELVERTEATPGNLGIRIIAAFPPPMHELTRLIEGGYDQMLEEAQRRRTPVFLFVSGHLPVVTPIAERYPDLQLIVDHLGIRQPPLDPRDDPPFTSPPQLVELAKYPNVAVKLCGVPALSEDVYPFDDVWPAVHEVLGAFGTDRVFWASDIPRFQGRISWDFTIESAWKPYPGGHTYADSLAFVRDTDQLTVAEKRNLLGGCVRNLLEWPL